ncbi:RES domain-containing protein [Mycobacterium ulcerans]
MVADLGEPNRPLSGGRVWTWKWPETLSARGWQWCRVYHLSAHTPDAITHRAFGPLHRLDHHTPPAAHPAICPEGRSVLYVAGTLATALGEVSGDLGEAAVCPRFRVGLLRPRTEIVVLDLRSEGAAMRIGALPSLATGAIHGFALRPGHGPSTKISRRAARYTVSTTTPRTATVARWRCGTPMVLSTMCGLARASARTSRWPTRLSGLGFWWPPPSSR